MMKTARPFVASLKAILQHRLPADEIGQIVDESTWEFEKLEHAQSTGKSRNEAYARFCSLCLAFYRAMVSVGMDKHTAASTIAQAYAGVDWTPVPVRDAAACSVARYFGAQGALDLCETAFCRECPQYAGGCAELRDLKAQRA